MQGDHSAKLSPSKQYIVLHYPGNEARMRLVCVRESVMSALFTLCLPVVESPYNISSSWNIMYMFILNCVHNIRTFTVIHIASPLCMLPKP